MEGIVKKKSKRNYVNGPDFYQSILEYQTKVKLASEEGKPKPRIGNYIGECIYKIATKLGTKYNFSGYSFRDEMECDAIEKMIEAVEKYDVDYYQKNPSENPNPLGYFSQVAWNCFLQRISSEKKEQYIKHKNFEKTYYHEFENFKKELDNFEEMFDNEDHNRIINDFETSKTKKKENSGYAVHRNLDYSRNRMKKSDKDKKDKKNE